MTQSSQSLKPLLWLTGLNLILSRSLAHITAVYYLVESGIVVHLLKRYLGMYLALTPALTPTPLAVVISLTHNHCVPNQRSFVQRNNYLTNV